MRRLFMLPAAAMLALAACGGHQTDATSAPNSASADLPTAVSLTPGAFQATTMDEKIVDTLWSGLDLADTAVEAAHLTKGSPEALSVAADLKRAKTALNAATAAQRAGSTADWLQAVADAGDALRLARAAINPLPKQ